MFCEINQVRFGMKNEKTEASRSCPDLCPDSTVITCENNFAIKLIEKSKFVWLVET